MKLVQWFLCVDPLGEQRSDINREDDMRPTKLTRLVVGLALIFSICVANLALGGQDKTPSPTELISIVESGSAEERFEAVRILGDMGPNAMEALPTLLSVLGDRTQFQVHDSGPTPQSHGAFTVLPKGSVWVYTNTGAQAAKALARIANPDALVPILADSLSSANSNVRENAAHGLAAIGTQAEEAIAQLLAVIDASDGFDLDRDAAFSALGKIGEPSVDSLVELLTHSQARIRIDATRALGSTGSTRAIDHLIGQLSDSNVRVREASASALAQIGAPAYEDVVGQLLADNPVRKRYAVMALRKMGQEEATGRIIPLLQSADDELLEECAKALEELSGEGFGTDYDEWLRWWREHEQPR